MHIKITKRTGLLLFLVAICQFSFGAESRSGNLKIVLSNNQRKLAAVVVPLVIAGGTYLYSQYGSSSLPSIPYEAKCGVGTLVSIPVLHWLLGRVEVEDKGRLYATAVLQFEKSKFNKDNNKEKVNAILQMEDAVQAASALTTFINSEFGKNPRVAAEDHLLELKLIVEKGRKAFKEINDSPSYKNLGARKERLKKLLQILRASEHHETAKTNYDKQQRTKLKTDKATFTSQVGAFIPMFIRPVSSLCMVLLNILLTKLGL